MICRPERLAHKKAWRNYYEVKREAQGEYDKKDAVARRVFKDKVTPALERAINTPIN